jgi:hypothetical protein
MHLPALRNLLSGRSPGARLPVPGAWRAAVCAAVLGLAPLAAQTRVDLSVWQTPLKNQGSRNTCVTFSAVAALEAAYARAGQPGLDLSEEFQNYVGKLFWLHPRWNEVTSASQTENQVAAFGGGGGTGHVRWLAQGMRVPTELDLPYRPSGYDLGAHPNWNDPHWQVQRNVDDFNLDRAHLPRAALTAPRYYRATGFAMLGDARSAAAIESALRSSREVVWDFDVRGDRSGPIWRSSAWRPSAGAHSMLIVGYDRSSADPNQHHFICKNSWGPTGNAGGFTLIGYDYLQYGYSAATITGVATPEPWPQLGFVGRWNLCFDGWRGTLDINHLPGIAQLWLDEAGANAADRRVGVFYDTNGSAFRVNGRVQGDKLEFWFKGQHANMRWDDLRESTTGVGRGFSYSLVDGDSVEMAGWHQDNPGLIPNPAYGGYARQPTRVLGTDGFLSPNFDPATPVDVLQYLGSWDLQFAGISARISFERRDDTLVPAALRGVWAGLASNIIEGGASRIVTAMVHLGNPRSLDLAFRLNDGRAVTMDCWMLSRQRGVFAGAATVGFQGSTEGVYGVRVADHVAGSLNTFGTGCGGASGVLRQTATGTPSVGARLYYHLGSAPANAAGVLNFGLSDRITSAGLPLPFELSPLGAPGCWFLTESALANGVVTDAGGRRTVAVEFRSTSMIGMAVFTQFILFDSPANALGLTFSNGVRTRLGG